MFVTSIADINVRIQLYYSIADTNVAYTVTVIHTHADRQPQHTYTDIQV